MLHVTNGSSVSLAETGLGGDVLVWADVLCEGPVPARLDLDELTRLRCIFFDREWAGVAGALTARNQALARFTEHEEVVLWFEHDLYDQLQLIQILDWLRARDHGSARLSLISTVRYLGMLTGAQLAEFWPKRHAITAAEFDLAAAAWQAFRSPDPAEIETLLRADTSALPFLEGALLRHLEQFPSVANGLARTERQILELVRAGTRSFWALFSADQELEERIFMGDVSFRAWIRGLAGCRHPLLQEDGGGYRLTDTGEKVLDGGADHVRLNGINRWLGGVHLDGPEALWRWDEAARRLAPH